MTATRHLVYSASVDLVRTTRRQLRRFFSSRLGIAAGIAALTLVLAFGALFWARSTAESQIRQRLAQAVQSRFGLAAQAGSVDVGFGSLIIRDLRIVNPEQSSAEPLASIDRIEVEFGVWAALRKRGEIHSVVVNGLSANLIRRVDGTFEHKAPFHSPSDQSKEPTSSLMALALPETVAIHNISIHLDDQKRKTITNLAAVSAQVRLADLRQLDLKSLEVRSSDASLDELLAANRGVDLRGRVDSAEVGIVLDLEGAYEDTNESFTISGRINGQASSNIESRSAGGIEDLDVQMQLSAVAVKRVNSILKSTALASDADATVTGMINVRYPVRPKSASLGNAAPHANRLEVSVDLDATSLRVFHPILATKPVTDLNVTTTFVAHVQTAPLVVAIKGAEVQVGDIEMKLDLEYASPAQQSGSERMLSLKFVLPKSDCQELFSSMPRSLIPSLEGFELVGMVSADIDLQIDWGDFEATVFDHVIDASSCRVVRAPAKLTAENLNGPFVHTVNNGTMKRDILLGPQNPNYVALTDTSRALQRSLVYSEDPNFHSHVGFSRLLRDVLVRNLKQGRFAWGGSTITNQLVKNVFLRREKTLARKLQEYFITWHLENTISKDRILELYVNAIEYGPNLYGLKPAARQYFDKSPDQLTTVESAFLSTLLPAPLIRYRQYCDDQLEKSTEEKLERIVDGLWTYKRLTEEEYLISLEQWVRFKGDKAVLCGKTDAVATR